MNEIGKKLKKQRESLGLTIGEISLQTKINSRILKNMEEGNLEDLPAKSFLRGFVKTYANYLKMDTDALLEEFNAEFGSTSHQPKQMESVKIDIDTPLNFFKNKSNQKKMLSVAVLAALLGLTVFIKNVFDKYQLEKAINPEVSKITTLPAVEVESPKPEVESTPPVPALKESKEATTKAPDKTPEPEEVKKEVVVEERAKEKEKPPEPVVEKKIASEDEEKKEVEKVEEKKPEIQISTAQQVILEALDGVTVDFKKDQNSEQTKKLRAGQVLVINAKKKIYIELSDAGAVNLTHNGINKGTPGELGKSVEVTYE